jgi:hypothetical protein
MRVERRLILALADGSTLTLDPGSYWIDEDTAPPTITWESTDGEETSPIFADEVQSHLTRKDFVFTSW